MSGEPKSPTYALIMQSIRKRYEAIAQNEQVRDAVITNRNLAIVKVIAAIFTQPIHVGMRFQQAGVGLEPPELLGIRQAYQIILQGGWPALYKGIGVAGLKELLKSLVYKGFVTKKAYEFSEQLLPDSLTENLTPLQRHLLIAGLGSAIAAPIDSVLGGPLEMWATYLSTSHGIHAKAKLSREFANLSPIQSFFRLYQGFVPATLKTALAYFTFLAISAPIQNTVSDLYQLKPGEDIPWSARGLAACGIGMTVAAVTSPLDIVKTNSQMPGATLRAVMQRLSYIYSVHGVQGLSAGLWLKAFQVTIGWGVTFLATQETTHQRVMMK